MVSPISSRNKAADPLAHSHHRLGRRKRRAVVGAGGVPALEGTGGGRVISEKLPEPGDEGLASRLV
jgi:hypothetical protein